MPFVHTLIQRMLRFLIKRHCGRYILEFSQDDLTYTINGGTLEDIDLNIEVSIFYLHFIAWYIPVY